MKDEVFGRDSGNSEAARRMGVDEKTVRKAKSHVTAKASAQTVAAEGRFM